MSDPRQIIAVDPGEKTCGYVRMRIGNGRILEANACMANDLVLRELEHWAFGADKLKIAFVIEDFVIHGKRRRACNRTIEMIGQCERAWSPHTMHRISRREVMVTLCRVICRLAGVHSFAARSSHLRQALIDLYGGEEAAIGTPEKPGVLAALQHRKDHAWSAAGIAAAYAKHYLSHPHWLTWRDLHRLEAAHGS